MCARRRLGSEPNRAEWWSHDGGFALFDGTGPTRVIGRVAISAGVPLRRTSSSVTPALPSGGSI